MTATPTVLISYSQEDELLAKKVLQALQAKHINCWTAFENISPSESWPAAITEAINNCGIFLLILTKNSNNSRQVIRELTQADNLNKKLYCFQTEDIKISADIQYFFSSIQRNEAFRINFEIALKKMIADIQLQFSKLVIETPKKSEELQNPLPVEMKIQIRKFPGFLRNKKIIAGLIIVLLIPLSLVFFKKSIWPDNSVSSDIGDINFVNSGEEYFNQKKYAEAISSFDSAIALNSSNAKALFYRGNSHYMLGNYSSAILDLTKALQLGAFDSSEIYRIRGNTFYFLNQYTDAISDYNKAESKNVFNSFTYSFRAESYLNINDYNSALRDFTKSIDMGSTDPDTYFERGRCFYSLNKYDSAILDFTKVLNLNQSDKRIYTWRGACYFTLNKYELAIKDLDIALQIDPNDIAALVNRGGAKRMLDLPGYCDDYKKADSLGDEDGKKYYDQYCGVKK